MVYTVTSDSGYTYTYKNKTAYDSDPNKPKTSTKSNSTTNTQKQASDYLTGKTTKQERTATGLGLPTRSINPNVNNTGSTSNNTTNYHRSSGSSHRNRSTNTTNHHRSHGLSHRNRSTPTVQNQSIATTIQAKQQASDYLTGKTTKQERTATGLGLPTRSINPNVNNTGILPGYNSSGSRSTSSGSKQQASDYLTGKTSSQQNVANIFGVKKESVNQNINNTTSKSSNSGSSGLTKPTYSAITFKKRSSSQKTETPKPTQTQSIDYSIKEKQEAEAKRIAETTGGTYLDPHGRGFSSALTPTQLGINSQQNVNKNPLLNYLTPTGFETIYTKDKPFLGGITKTSSVYYDPITQQTYSEDFATVEERSKKMIQEAKTMYTYDALGNKVPTQTPIEEEIQEEEKPKLNFLQQAGQTIQEAATRIQGKNFIVPGATKRDDRLGFLSFTSPIEFFPKTLPTLQTASGALVKGAGETIEAGGNIWQAASKKETYEKIFGTAIDTGKYFVDVGFRSKIHIRNMDIIPGVKLPVAIVEFPEKNRKDLAEAGILAGTTGVSIVKGIASNPVEEVPKIVGSGLVIGKTVSAGNKLLGLGKAGIAIAKGGKYVKSTQLYEVNPKNLIGGKYKRGTPKSTIKEFETGKNPKTLIHSTGTDPFAGKTKMKVKVPDPTKLPKTDPKSLFTSTGAGNEVYLRLGGSSYNVTPRIPFFNTPTPVKPTTLRLIGSTKPQRLYKVGKFKKLSEAKKVFETAKTSKNIPYTSPANELGLKIENEALLREGAILTKKGVKGIYDFTFVDGVFVKTPRVRVMPSKPTKFFTTKKIVKKPTKPSILKRPKKEISFSQSIAQSKNPGTFYNIFSPVKSSASKTSSSKIYSTSSVSFSKSSSSSNIISSSGRLISSSLTPSISTSTSTSTSSGSGSGSSSRPSKSTSTSSGSGSSSSSRIIPKPSTPTIPVYKPSLLPQLKPTKKTKKLAFFKSALYAPGKRFGVKNVTLFKNLLGNDKRKLI